MNAALVALLVAGTVLCGALAVYVAVGIVGEACSLWRRMK